MDTIILIGQRRAAVDAVDALGFHPLVINRPARPEQARYAFGGGPSLLFSDVAQEIGNHHPLAVIATAEGAVPMAAMLRQQYGLPGITPHTANLVHNKLAMKRAASNAGIPCAPWMEVSGSTSSAELADVLGFPMLLKIPISSGGRGVQVVEDQTQSGPGLVKHHAGRPSFCRENCGRSVSPARP